MNGGRELPTSRREVRVASGLGVGTWEWDIALRKMEWSAELRALYGFVPDAPIEASFETFIDVVHPHDRASVIATVSKTVATRRAGHEQRFRVVRPDGQIRHFLSRARLTCDGNGEPILLSGVNIDLGDCGALLPDAERSVTAQEDRWQATFRSAPTGYAHISPEGKCLSANDEFCRITGYAEDELVGKPLQDFVHEADRDLAATHLEVIRSGASDKCSFEERLVRKDGTFLHVFTKFSCVRTSAGAIEFLLAGVDDISDRRQSEQRQQLLLNEMTHRGQNLLSIIQSIARRTLTGDRSLKEARDALCGRLQALARTYETVSNPASDGIELSQVLKNELTAFSERVHITGPRVLLAPKVTQTLALVVHELATNTCKYGALSVPDGQVFVTWHATGDAATPVLEFDWREEGGPPLEPPKRQGLGTTLISVVAGAELDCKPQLRYDPRGFQYKFEAPLARVGTVVIDTPVRRRLKNPIVRSLYECWVFQRGQDGRLPNLANFDWSRFAKTGALSIAKITPQNEVQFIQLGHALIERLNHSVAEISQTHERNLTSTTKSHLQCAQNGEPRHEYLRFDFGDDDPVTFECLLVPFGSAGHQSPTHVVGIAVFEGQTGDPEKLTRSETPSFRRYPHQDDEL